MAAIYLGLLAKPPLSPAAVSRLAPNRSDGSSCGHRRSSPSIVQTPARTWAVELEQADGIVRYEAAGVTNNPALRTTTGRIRDAFGPADLLMDNAAHDAPHPAEEVTKACYHSHNAGVFKRQFFAAQTDQHDIKVKQAGAIANFRSISRGSGGGGRTAYIACKSTMLGLRRPLVRDDGFSCIRATCLEPRRIMTERQTSPMGDPETGKEIYGQQQLKRKLYPIEMPRSRCFSPLMRYAAPPAGTGYRLGCVQQPGNRAAS